MNHQPPSGRLTWFVYYTSATGGMNVKHEKSGWENSILTQRDT